MRSCTVVVTLGPATPTAAHVRALLEAGANQARLNASHLATDGLVALAGLAMEGGFSASDIVVDLQGGKSRLGPLPAPISVEDGQEVWLPACSSKARQCQSTRADRLWCSTITPLGWPVEPEV